MRVAVDYNNPLGAPRVELWRAKLLVAQGEHEKARAVVTPARDEFARRGEIPYLTLADELLKELS